MSVQIHWEWSEEPSLVVDRNADGIIVRAHPGLSEAQVRQACAHLGDDGQMVLQAWGRASGLQS